MQEICEQAKRAAELLCEQAKLRAGELVVVGCSTSEICGSRIGTDSQPEVAETVFRAIYDVLQAHGVELAAQCCEHLNRALIVERRAAQGRDIVNVVPQPKAGGSFATAAYRAFADPVAVEHIRADAGLDIGGTLLGIDHIGQALLLAARTRPKFIGGVRAHYNENLL